jgi:acetylornithine deacetylase/succinyl-diaminopimelate desuccinylase-like protein
VKRQKVKGDQMPKLILTTVFFLLNAAYAANTDVEKIRDYASSRQIQILREFVDLLAIPNVASDEQNIRRNAEHISKLMSKRGIQTRLLEVQGAPPAVYGELNTPVAKHTVGIYVHYDGQPVDASQWTGDPWKPVLRNGVLEEGAKEVPLQSPVSAEWRLYARSASDDKAPIIGWLTAIDALKSLNLTRSVNIKFLFEGEEEAGSPHLPQLMEKYSELLKTDVWLFCDGPVHQSRRKQLFFGARGVLGVDMMIYGPLRALHSGHYGNWAPNPIAMLAELLTSMRDSEGNIKIAHFLDHVRPLSESELQAIRKVPDTEAELKGSLALGRAENAGKSLPESIISLPAFNFRGVESGHVGSKATNAIPTEATASIDIRLIPDLKPEDVRSLIEAHIQRRGYYIVHETPSAEIRKQYPKVIKLSWEDGYPAARTSMDLPPCLAVVKTIESNLGELIQMPSLGGSIPMYLFLDKLNTPVVGVPIANHDNNQHAANENIRLQNLWDGIELYGVLLLDLEKNW